MNLETWRNLVSDALLTGDTSPFAAIDEDLPWRVEVYLTSMQGNDGAGLVDFFPHVAGWLRARGGTWPKVVRDFQFAHPPQHESRIVCYEPFPAFLAARADIPAWMPELARLHAAARSALVAPDEVHPRVEPTARIDRFTHDVLGWCGEGDPDYQTEPEERPTLVLTWRAEDLFTRHAEVGLLEEHLLERLRAGLAPDPAVLAEIEAGPEDVEAAIEALIDAGILYR